jgi:hypothetical protein
LARLYFEGNSSPCFQINSWLLSTSDSAQDSVTETHYNGAQSLSFPSFWLPPSLLSYDWQTSTLECEIWLYLYSRGRILSAELCNAKHYCYNNVQILLARLEAEVDKVTLKSNGAEALSDESL